MSERGDLALARILEEERVALREADYARLTRLAERKFALLEGLAELEPERLAPLARTIARNQSLLEAALAGLRDAGRRRGDRAAAAASFGTYDRNGSAARVGGVKGSLERRA